MKSKPLAQGLRLLAEEADDLAVISAAVQDGLVAMADVQWLKARRRLSVKFQRYCHERAPVGGARHGQRVWSVLAFEGVTAVRARKLAQARPAAYAAILTVSFQAGEAPGGTITLTLADDGVLALDVECIDAVLADLGEARPALAKPDHG